MKTKRAKQSFSSRLNGDNVAAPGERWRQQVKLHLAARQSSPSFADVLFCFVSRFLLAALKGKLNKTVYDLFTSAELDLIKIPRIKMNC